MPLVLRDVSVDLGGRPVLRDVSLSVGVGELVGLVGPNGAGKTTLLRAVLGLVELRCGEVLLGGRRRSGVGEVGYVPQRHEFAWDFPVSVEQVVMTGRTARLGLWRRPSVQDWVQVRAALDRVELSDLAARPVAELSGGQRQRVLVARALALGASRLLLDEPFTGLDLPTQDLLSRLFVRLAQEGCAVLMTTHDLVAAVAGCDRLVLLHGRVVADGPPDRLCAEDWQRTFGVDERSAVLRLVAPR